MAADIATQMKGLTIDELGEPRLERAYTLKFVGAVTDQKVIQDCLRDCLNIICAIGGNSFFPDTSLRVSARSIVDALKGLRERSNSWRRPRMVYLSSSSRNVRFAAARPPVVHWLIETAF